MQTTLSTLLAFERLDNFIVNHPHCAPPPARAILASSTTTVSYPTENGVHFFELPVSLDWEGRFMVAYEEDFNYCYTSEEAHFALLHMHMVHCPYLWQMQTKQDIIEALKYLIVDTGLLGGFHVDTEFKDYAGMINETTEATLFSTHQAAYYDEILNRCEETCKQLKLDIYELANDVYVRSKITFPYGGIDLYKRTIEELIGMNGTEVAPVAIFSLGGQNREYAERLADEDAELACFWSVYARFDGRGTECIADCETKELAIQFAELLEACCNGWRREETEAENRQLVAIDQIRDIIYKAFLQPKESAAEFHQSITNTK